MILLFSLALTSGVVQPSFLHGSQDGEGGGGLAVDVQVAHQELGELAQAGEPSGQQLARPLAHQLAGCGEQLVLLQVLRLE